MEDHIELIEKLSLNAFPALKKEEVDGWILQYSKGYTYRANSICPLNNYDRNIKEKVSICEEKYREKNMPTIFKIIDHINHNLDSVLEEMGYSIVKKVNLMNMDLNGYVKCNYTNIEVSRDLDSEWLDTFIELNKFQNVKDKDIHVKMIKNIQEDLISVKAIVDNKIVGCGLGVIENDVVGLFDINVNREYRNRGLGTSICRGIINEAIDCNAKEVYLQVSEGNENAISIYKKIGFKKLYKYWFRKSNNMRI